MKTLMDIAYDRGWAKKPEQVNTAEILKEKRRQQIRESTARMRARKKSK